MLAVAAGVTLLLAPQIGAVLAADHSPEAVSTRLASRPFTHDNDLMAIFIAAPQVGWPQVWRWLVSGDWIDVSGGGPFWRPVVSALWWAEYQLFGQDFLLYNLVSIALVALTCGLLAGGLAAWTGELLLGVAAAGFLWWRTTTTLSGVLDWFPAQTDLLAGLGAAAAFYLVAVGLRAQGPLRRGLLAGSLACYLLATLAKESVIAFPLGAAALLWWGLGRRSLPWIGAYGLLGLALVAGRTLILGGIGERVVLAGSLHLLHRAAVVLAGNWLGVAVVGWQSLGSLLLVAPLVLAVVRPGLLRRRAVAYGLVGVIPVLLVLLAHHYHGSALVLLLPVVWGQLWGGVVYLACALLLVWRRRRQAAVLACLAVALSAQLVLGRYWGMPYYHYVYNIACAAMNGLVVAAVWELVRAWGRRLLGPQAAAG